MDLNKLNYHYKKFFIEKNNKMKEKKFNRNLKHLIDKIKDNKA